MNTEPSKKKYIEIGRRLAQLRKATHPDLNIKEYVKLIDVSYTRYLNWESGLNRPKPDEAETICIQLGVTMDWIYRGIAHALPQNTAKALSSIPFDSATKTSSDRPH